MKSKQVIILGMHRSGTSLLSHYLSLIGINMGEKLMGMGPGNPYGHFEDEAFIAINKNIMEENHLQLFTDNIQQEFDKVKEGLSVSDGLGKRISRLVNTRDSKYELWGWKDPRTVLTFEVWRRYCPDAYIIILFRKAENVIDSLIRRGKDKEIVEKPVIALKSWILYNKLLLWAAKVHDNKRILAVNIDDLLKRSDDFNGYLRESFLLKVRQFDIKELIRERGFKDSLTPVTARIIKNNPKLYKESQRIYKKLMLLAKIK